MRSTSIQTPRRAPRFQAVAVLCRREMRSTLRSARAYWLAAAGVVLALLILMTRWNPPAAFNARTPFGQDLFRVYFGILLAIATLVLPAMAALATAVERQRDCLDMLLAAPIRIRDIILAKFLAALSYYLLLAVAGLPLMGIMFFFAGIEVRQFLLATLLLILCATTGAACGVFSGASGMRGVSTFAAVALAMLLHWFIPSTLGPASSFHLMERYTQAVTTFDFRLLFYAALIGACVLATLLFAAGWRLARHRKCAPGGRSILGGLTNFLDLTPWLLARLTGRNLFLYRFRHGLLVGDSSLRGLLQLTLACFAYAGCLAVVLFLFFAGDARLFAAIGSFLPFICFFALPLVIVPAFLRERGNHTWDMLRMVPLRPIRLLDAFSLAILLRLLPLALPGIVCMLFTAALMGRGSATATILWCCLLYGSCVSYFVFAIAMAANCSGTLSGVIGSYIWNFFFSIGLGMLSVFTDGAEDGHLFGLMILLIISLLPNYIIFKFYKNTAVEAIANDKRKGQ